MSASLSEKNLREWLLARVHVEFGFSYAMHQPSYLDPVKCDYMLVRSMKSSESVKQNVTLFLIKTQGLRNVHAVYQCPR